MTNVFEMLWDCRHCGTKKLLGKTQRFCPNCGAPQDAEGRYMPSDAEKVAVEGHVFVGADRICGSCGTAMSAAAAHCSQCGASLDGAAEVGSAPAPRRPSGRASRPRFFLAEDEPPSGPQVSRLRSALIVGAILSVMGVAMGLFLWLVDWQRAGVPAVARIGNVYWERRIDVQQQSAVSESDWCASMPGGAFQITRSRRDRSTRSADGEDCTTARIDQRDGTFREERRCTTRYRDETRAEEWCEYQVIRWVSGRPAVASGPVGTEPAWPSVRAGVQREGERQASFMVQLSVEGRGKECSVDEAVWRRLRPKQDLPIRVSREDGSPLCDSIGQSAAAP